MSNLTKRLLTGISYVTLLLIAIMHPISTYLLFSVVAILGLGELKKIYDLQHIKFDIWASIIIGLTTYATIIYNDLKIILFIEIILYFISLLFQTKKYTLNLIGSTIFSTIYIFIPLALIIPIAFTENDTYNYKLLFGLFILVWSSDSWAFIFGKLFGKRKLLKKISPNKTWEGFLGSLIFTTATGYLLSLNGFELSSKAWVILGVFTSLFATAGDLFQSMLKREANLKDSGAILPGHGGVLDRFDSLFFCLPMYYIYFYHLNCYLNF